VSRDEAVEELRRGEGPTSIVIDVLRLEFNIINLLLTNDLLQASHHRVVGQWATSSRDGIWTEHMELEPYFWAKGTEPNKGTQNDQL